MTDALTEPRTVDAVAGQTLRREFTMWSAFSFAFAFISPIVALYGIFGLSITTAGARFWWNIPLVFGGQLLIALVFSELVSRWPLEGSIYQWTRRLIGPGTGWFAGWVYLATLIVAMATVALGAAGFLANAVGTTVSGSQQALVAIGVLAVGTMVNIAGTRALRVVMTCSIVAETLGTIGLGTLLLFHRHQGLSVLSQTSGGSHYFTGPFLLAMSFLGFSFVGFESAGSIAEEVHRPKHNLPKAVIFSLAVVALLVGFAGLSLILAIPDLGAVLSGEVADPVYATLTSQLGSAAARFAEVLFAVAFLASFLALQTSASRVVWAYARDHALPFSGALSRLSERQKQPVPALLIATAIGALMIGASQQTPKFYQLMLNFSAAGFFAAYLFPLTGRVLAGRRGRWVPGPVAFARRGNLVAALALAWCVFEFLNLAYPRQTYPQWYLNWSVEIAVVALAVVGGLIYLRVQGSITLFTGTRDAKAEPDDEPALPA